MSVLANVLGLLLAVALGAGQHGIEAIIVAFTYYSSATKRSARRRRRRT